MPVLREVDCVGENLRLETGKGGEFPDRDRVRAIDEMPIRDVGMLAENQLGAALRFRCEVTRWPQGETGDPVAAPDRGVLMQMKKRDVFAKCKISDRAVRFHDEASRKDPCEPDAAGRMEREAKLFLEKRSTKRPREQEAEKHEQCLHSCGVRLR